MKIKRYKLKPKVKTSLLLLSGAFIGISIYQVFIVKEVKITPYGDYVCRGGIIKTCGANKEVANYLGV